MNESIISKIKSDHRKFFSEACIMVKAPGRANIIGEHTDYNHGLVLPFAINQGIYFIVSKNQKAKLRITAHDINENYESAINPLEYRTEGWTRYFNNALVALDINLDSGIDVTFGGDLPSGAGVSSSSAITCGFMFAVNHLFRLGHDTRTLILLASQAENGIGLNGGTMDQTSIFRGLQNTALLIDYYHNTITPVELNLGEYQFYLFESGQQHNLVDTAYNKRRATCEEALKLVQAKYPLVDTMRQMSLNHVNEVLTISTMKKRCAHVINENERVRKAQTAIASSDFVQLGNIMLQTHKSLSQSYEVSTKEIDFLVARSQQIKNVLGSRIMGGGFGGCTINLVRDGLTETELQELAMHYKAETGMVMKWHKITPSNGVQLI